MTLLAQNHFTQQYPQAKNAKPATVGAVTGLKLNQAAAWGVDWGYAYPYSAHLGRRVQRVVPMTIHEIQVAVALQCGVTLLDLLSERRGLAFARPRQMAMWLALHLTPRAITEIGRAFGRDHSTVLHGIGRVDAAIAAGDAWGVQAALMKQELAGRMAA